MSVVKPCASSGFRAGVTKRTKVGVKGWCMHCGAWRAVTPTGKFKKHEATEPKPPEPAEWWRP